MSLGNGLGCRIPAALLRVGMLDHSNVFLPRVNSCPRVVMISAVGRGLKSLYADLLEQSPPEDIATLVKRIDQVTPRRD
jgi:hypothetical protein